MAAVIYHRGIGSNTIFLFLPKRLQKYIIIHSETKTIYGQLYRHCNILFSKRIGFAWDLPIFAADNNGTVVLLWHDQQA
jgi:hypothetical protein